MRSLSLQENRQVFAKGKDSRCGRLNSLVLLLSLIALAGCGGSGRPTLIDARGQVTLDGQPVEGAQIYLEYTGEVSEFKRPISATTDAEGNFVLNAYADDSGVPPGTYRVAVLKKEQVGELPKNYDPELASNFRVKYRWTVPKKYSEMESSGLTLEVTDDGLSPAVLELSSDGQPPLEEFEGGRTQNDA